jgi:hypothetical protein
MGFSTGEKIRVLNTGVDVLFYDAAGAAIAEPTALTDTMAITGYGTFPLGDIKAINMARAVLASKESKNFTVVAPTGLAIGDSIGVKIATRSTRDRLDQSQHLGLSGQTRGMVFSTAPLLAVDAASIAAAVAVAYAAHEALFIHADMELTVVAGTFSTSDILVESVVGFEDTTVEGIVLTRMTAGIALGYESNLVLNVPAPNTDSYEGRGQGKFLEESIRMNTAATSDIYGIDTMDTRVDIRGNYTNISFAIAGFDDENHSFVAPDHGSTLLGTPFTSLFSLFLNETELGTDGPIHNIAKLAALVAASDALTTVTGTYAGNERTEAFLTGVETSVISPALFIA